MSDIHGSIEDTRNPNQVEGEPGKLVNNIEVPMTMQRHPNWKNGTLLMSFGGGTLTGPNGEKAEFLTSPGGDVQVEYKGFAFQVSGVNVAKAIFTEMLENEEIKEHGKNED